MHVRSQFIGGNEEWINMVADGASAHRSRVAAEKLVELKIRYMQMPAYTPEMNSIERLWNYLKKAVM